MQIHPTVPSIRHLPGLVLLAAAGCAMPGNSGAEAGGSATRFLAIAGSHSEVSGALAQWKKLQAEFPDLQLIASDDCGGLRSGLFLVAVNGTGAGQANQAVARLRTRVADAYVRQCSPKEASRLSLGVALVDPSIASVPEDAVNWSDADRIAEVRKLPRGYLWIRRSYEAKSSAEDPREGRRESVLFFEKEPGQARMLIADCPGPQAAQSGNWIAVACEHEVAGDQLLHQVHVFDSSTARQVQSAERCRDPQFSGAGDLSCKAESVNADGELTLKGQPIHYR